MSKKIDERVVEMRFDNRQFESATATTMSTLDRLKQKLNFSGSTKGFSDVGTAARNAEKSMSPLASAVQTVEAKFSALQVVGVTALANITNSAVNAGKRLISALTIDPIKTGLSEYETQIGAVQTILANTQSKGSTLDDVNRALNELNKYADQTIYNFTEMTRNIGTFTAAGVDLDKSVTAIKGIANLAAVSGSTSQQASTAMYQLSQALAAGRVSLMDWNSVVNAGMGGEVFQTALKRTATQMGHNVDALIEKYGSFRESLTKGQWLTAEVLTETLTQISGAYSKADLLAQGYTESQANEIIQLAETAVGAATDVKTFTGMMDTLKESLQSGWAQSWELIIGDFEQAKALWTNVSTIFGNVIQTMSDARNALLGGALDSNWDKLTDKVVDAGVSVEDFNEELEKTARAKVSNFDDIIKKSGSLAKAFQDGSLSSDLIIETLKRMGGVSSGVVKSTEDMTKKLEYFQKVVNEVWHGDYKNGEERVKALAAAGYDYAQVQALVNKTVDGHKLTLEDLGDAQLKSIGYTTEEITKLRALAEQAEKTGTPLNELINEITKPSGRELLWDGILNIFSSLINIGKAIGEAWRDAFSIDSSGLYHLIEAFHSLTEALVPSEETLKGITGTFKGLFAILDIIVSVVGGVIKTVFGALGTVLGTVDFNILSVTGSIGESIASFRDWLLEGGTLTNVLSKLGIVLVTAGKAVKKLVTSFGNFPVVEKAVTTLKNGLSELPKLGKWIVEGLQNGLSDGINSIPAKIIEIAKSIINAFKTVLGINSPSKETYDIGRFTIEGFLNGFSDNAGKVIETIANFGSSVVSAVGKVFSNIDWGTVFAVAFTGGLLYAGIKIANAINAFSAPFRGIGDVLSSVGDVIEQAAKPISKVITSFSKLINAKAFEVRANAIKTIAVSIAILAASLFVLSRIPWKNLLIGVGAIAALAGIIVALSIALDKFGPKSSINLMGFGFALSGFSTSIAIIAASIKILDTLDPKTANQTINNFIIVMTSMIAFLGVCGAVAKVADPKAISKLGTLMLKLSISLALMVGVVKLISLLSTKELIKGGIAITAFVGIMALLSKAASVGKDKTFVKLGTTMLAMSTSLLMMVAVVKLIGMLTVSELVKGGVAITAFVGIMALLSQVARIGKDQSFVKLGTTMLAMSASMLILAGVMKIIGAMNPGEIIKGGVAIAAFAGIIALLVTSLKGFEKEAPKIAATLMAMSLSLAIMAAVAVVLSLISIEGLAKGIIAVGMLGTIMSLMVASTKNAKDVKGTMIAMAVAIGIMAASITVLSFIDPAKLAGATAALTVLMGMFSLIMLSSSKVGGSMGVLLAMSAAIAVVGGIVYLLSTLPIDSVLETTASISILLLSLAASMKILDSVGRISASAMISIGVLTVAVAAIAAILGALSYLDVEPSIETAGSIAILLGAMAGVTAVLSRVGLLGVGPALQGALALDAVILVVGGLMAGIGALVTYFPKLEEFVNNGIGLLTAVGQGIGGFVGGIAGGFLSGLTSGLPAVADNLALFMEKLMPFIEGVKSVDGEVLASVARVAAMILMLTAAEFINGIAGAFSLFTGGSSLSDFAEELIPFGEAMAEFGSIIKGKVDAESMNAVANVGTMLAELNRSLPREGGLLQKFLGSQDLTKFSSDIVAFGQAIVAFSDTIAPNGTSKINAEAVSAAANAGKLIADLNSEIPSSGGALQAFLGEKDLGAFSEDMAAFGRAIVTFSDTIAPNGTSKVNSEAVTAAANAGKLIADLNDEIPSTGGALQAFLGEKDLMSFSADMLQFGRAVVAFSNIIAPNGTAVINSEGITAAANAGKMMSELNDSLPKTGGFLSVFTGEKTTMAQFGADLKVFGESLAAYSASIEGIKPESVTASANAASSLAALSDSLGENELFVDEITLSDFGKQLSNFGEYFYDYYESVEGINVFKLSSVITGVEDLIDLAKGIIGVDFGNLKSFGDNLKKMGNAGIDEFINSFDSASTRVSSAASGMIDDFVGGLNQSQGSLTSAISTILTKSMDTIGKMGGQFKVSGSETMTRFSEGVISQNGSVIAKFSEIVSKVITAIRGQYNNFRSSGEYLVEGFASGIRSTSWKAQQEAQRLANAVTAVTKKALDEHSPSRVFYGIGEYVVEGLADGIKENVKGAVDASHLLGKVIVASAKNVLGIESPSQVMRDEVGRYIVMGIAEGITEDMSAEEAAAQKASNIVNAFKTAFDEIDLAETTSDLEYELWTKMNPDATDYEKATAEIDSLKRQIELQSQRVQNANAEYQATLKAFGSSDQNTQEAYNKVLEEQISLTELAETLNSLQITTVENNRKAYQEYVSWLTENQDKLLGFGYSISDIQAVAEKQTGYDPNASFIVESVDIDKIVNDAMKEVEVVFKDNIATTAAQLSVVSTNVGGTMATAIGEGVSTNTPKISESTTTLVSSCAESIKTEQDAWIEAGEYLVEGLVQGIKNGTEAAVETAKELASSVATALKSSESEREKVNVSGISGAISGTYSGKTTSGSTSSIRPVLDISEVEKEITQLNDSYADKQVSSILSSSKLYMNDDSGSSKDGDGSGTSVYYTQNNYSPKALPRVEIYRQTKNQLSAFGKLVSV